MSKSKSPVNTRIYVGDDECRYSWDASPEDKPIRYTEEDGETWEKPVPVPGHHYCIKSHRHVDDITNDDHRCCCGNTHDESG